MGWNGKLELDIVNRFLASLNDLTPLLDPVALQSKKQNTTVRVEHKSNDEVAGSQSNDTEKFGERKMHR